jgi:TPR repeat protein
VDAAWFGEALRSDVAYDKSVMAVCKELIDPDQVFEWVDAKAKEGNGASQWLMSSAANNMHDIQERLRDAASAGFPEAQFELTWAIIGHQEGAAGNGADAPNVGDLLRASADTIPRSEMQLAVCEYYGCPGVPPDLDAAVTHAREAAERGRIEGLIEIGPHLDASQIDPDEVTAWTLINASLQVRGCGGNGFTVRWMQQTAAVLAASNISASARALADQYWQQYGPQMMSNLGCGS